MLSLDDVRRLLPKLNLERATEELDAETAHALRKAGISTASFSNKSAQLLLNHLQHRLEDGLCTLHQAAMLEKWRVPNPADIAFDDVDAQLAQARPAYYAAIRQAVSLRSLIESLGVALHADGELWRGKCPLHHEKNGASLLLYPNQHCHGKCSRGGDVVDFAKAYWGLSNNQETVERMLGCAQLPKIEQPPIRSYYPHPPSKWPQRNLEAIRTIVREEINFAQLQEKSPMRFEPFRGQGSRNGLSQRLPPRLPFWPNRRS